MIPFIYEYLKNKSRYDIYRVCHFTCHDLGYAIEKFMSDKVKTRLLLCIKYYVM